MSEYDMVQQFHRVFGHPAPTQPTFQDRQAAINRGHWIISECIELADATTLEAQADAYGDILYFAYGGFVNLGLPPKPVFAAIHAANMRKVQPDGSVLRKADGKIIKPADWYGPEKAIAEYTQAQSK